MKKFFSNWAVFAERYLFGNALSPYIIFILVITFGILVQCTSNTQCKASNSQKQPEQSGIITNNRETDKLYYFKVKKTGVCYTILYYASDGYEYGKTITCVPCDSLKNVEVEEIN